MGNVNAKEARSRSATVSEDSRYPEMSSSRRRANTAPGGSSTSHSSRRNKGSKSKGKTEEEENFPQGLVLDPSEMVDGGYLAPHGVYSGPYNYKYKIVRQLMIDRKLAPFYKGLNDFDEEWSDRQILAAVRGIPAEMVADKELVAEVQGSESLNNVLEEDEVREVDPVTYPPAMLAVPDAKEDSDSKDSKSTNDKSSIDEDLQPMRSQSTENTQISTPSSTIDSPPLVPLTVASEHLAAATATASTTAAQDLHHEDEEEIDEEMREILNMKAQAEHVEDVHSGSIDERMAAKARALSLESAAHEPYDRVRQRSNTTSRFASGVVEKTPLEVALYKEAAECPICFLFYPKYLNCTRCCLQPICTECFVQIKRADPHPPHSAPPSTTENISAASTPAESPRPDDEPQLVSEPASCPYCAVPDFGVVYYPPPFRSGIGAPKNMIYNGILHAAARRKRASSGTIDRDLSGPALQRRKGSLPPTASEVVSTDQIRPDWVQTLHSARQRLARRSAAATALHATAIIQNNSEDIRSSSSSTSSRRRHRFRGLSSSSRRQESRALEDMMLVEAIRLSMYDEENRRKQDREKRRASNHAESPTATSTDRTAAAAPSTSGGGGGAAAAPQSRQGISI